MNIKRELENRGFSEKTIDKILNAVQEINSDKSQETKIIGDIQDFWEQYRDIEPSKYDAIDQMCFNDHSTFENNKAIPKTKKILDSLVLEFNDRIIKSIPKSFSYLIIFKLSLTFFI